MAERPVRILSTRRRGGGGGGGGGAVGNGNGRKKRVNDSANNGSKRQQSGGGGRNIKLNTNPKNATQDDSIDQVGERIVWVNPGSEYPDVIRSITGAALPNSRHGFPVHVKANYDENTNLALKAIISAQKQIWENHSISVGLFPIFRDTRDELNLKLVQLVERPGFLSNPQLLDVAEELACSANTNPMMLAAKLKHSVQSFDYVTVNGIGARAVFAMTKAITITREYLEEDESGQDIVCFPDFVQVQLENRDEPSTAVRFVLMLTTRSAN